MKASRYYLVFFLVMMSFPLMAKELSFGRFGNLTLYGNTQNPEQVILFVSGDGGWNLGVVDMAQKLADLNALVVGFDINHYLASLRIDKATCVYPAGDFEMLSKFIQKELKLANYHSPLLVGYSSGATLVYAALAQAPDNTFAGAISLGFCPDLLLTKPLCRKEALDWKTLKKEKGVDFLPAKKLYAPWIVLNGEQDQVCDLDKTIAFVDQVAMGKMVQLPKVGHGYSVQKNWLPQFKAAYAEIVETDRKKNNPQSQASPADLSHLPLVELPTVSKTPWLAILLTGDGGWASLDQQIGAKIQQKGIPVVGFNTLKYFWQKRTAAESAKDLERVIRHYTDTWKKDRIILVGYSFGADVLPFMTTRLPADILEKVSRIALLGLSKTAEFEFHVTAWMGKEASKNTFPVYPELKKLADKEVLCLYGDGEQESLCPELTETFIKTIKLKGDHHLGGDYARITGLILEQIQ